MREKWKILFFLLLVISFVCIQTNPAFADGTEMLGMPGIPLMPGTGVAMGGTGLCAQPGSIEITVPSGATVEQVLLYWEGSSRTNPSGDSAIKISGTPDCETSGTDVTGTAIGGPTFTGNRSTITYRADISGIPLMSGANTIYVCGMDFDGDGISGECTSGDDPQSVRDNGAGIMVIYNSGTSAASVQVRDGNDYAYCANEWAISNGHPELLVTMPQTFTFAPSTFPRTASLSLFASSVAGTAAGSGPNRPSRIQVSVGSDILLADNLLNSTDGHEWDTVRLTVPVPAGASGMTIQAISLDDETDNECASFVWNTAALSLAFAQGCTPGYWKQSQHFGSWTNPPYSQTRKFGSVFTRTITVVTKNAQNKKITVVDPTLLQALNAEGGCINALARHAVAALLNAASAEVNYLYSTADIISMVQTALDSNSCDVIEMAKDKLDSANNAGCPLN